MEYWLSGITLSKMVPVKMGTRNPRQLAIIPVRIRIIKSRWEKANPNVKRSLRPRLLSGKAR